MKESDLLKKLLEQYLKNLTDTTRRGDAREESYYKHLDDLIKQFVLIQSIKKVDVTILPKKTEAGNPDFRIWDGKNHITGYIEAKDIFNAESHWSDPYPVRIENHPPEASVDEEPEHILPNGGALGSHVIIRPDMDKEG